MSGPDEALRARREAKVLAHLEAENRRDAAATVATMTRPHYEVLAFGIEVDGAEAVQSFLESYFEMLPDITTTATRFHHADDALVVETHTTGTHAGTIEGVGPNGNPIDVHAVGIFYFDGDDLIGEKVVSDMATLMRQITGAPVVDRPPTD